MHRGIRTEWRRRILVATGGVPIPWYKAGGTPAPVAVYQPKGAASYAASKINLANPGTYDLSDGAAFPSWTSASGWDFNPAATQYLTVASAVIANVPLTMVARFNPDIDTDNIYIMSICDTAANNLIGLHAHGGAPGDPVGLLVADPVADIVSTTGWTVGNWFTGAGVAASADTRSAFIDGGSKATLVFNVPIAGLDTTYIGAIYYGGALILYFDGKISACAFYNIALSDAQVLALHIAMAAL